MRKVYHIRLKEHFHHTLVQTRENKELSQAQIAEKLAMGKRSYIDLDHGKTRCNAVIVVLILIYICKEIGKFLSELSDALEAGRNKAA